MDTSIMNFDFGPVTSDLVRMSMYGIAVKNVDGNYVSYDKANDAIMNVDIMNIPVQNMMFKMPVAIEDVKSADVVIHNRVPMIVVETKGNVISAIDVREGTRKDIYLTKSPFGFNFATKVVSMLDFGDADSENPFGTMLPFLMMNGNQDAGRMPFLMMAMSKNSKIDPLMAMLMMSGDNKDSNMMPILAMSMLNKDK